MVQETRTKVVVRLLPPSLTEDGFKNVIGEWLEATDWISYWKGKPSAPVLNHSRAYLNFKDPSDVFRFKAAFNGKNFITDKTGQQYRCVVEYAPYQRLARRKGRHDNKENTVEKDEDYREFVARLEAGPELLPSAEVQLQQKEAATAVGDGGTAGPTQTALMQYLKEKRAKKISRKILREPSAKAKGKSSGGAGAVGGDGGQSKKAKQRESRRERNSGNGPYGGGGDEGKEKERKKEKRSRKDKLKEKKTAAAAKTAGGGGGGEQPQAAPAVRILQRPGTSAPAASVGPSSSRPQPGLAATAAATKPPRKLVPVPITRTSPRAGGGPPSSAAAATAASAAGGGGGESNTTKSDATGRDNSSKRGRTKRGAGRGGGRGEAAAAGGREDGGGGGGGGSNRGSGRGGRGGKGARGSGRGSNSTAPMGNTSSTASASQPKIVPIVIARKPKPQPAAPAGGGGGGGAS
ncbi:hypothetical protein Ndes2526B_g00641 [Nannochloris sp. 'desiccata']|nr:putative Regulator of nonsense transcripts UPF3 [Chlorella desiccata (nom. nud.)]